MSHLFAAALCATMLWAAFMFSAFTGGPVQRSGEAWTVTASDKIASRPALVRIAVPVRMASND